METVDDLKKRYIDKARSMGLDHVHELSNEEGPGGKCLVCGKQGMAILMTAGDLEPFVVLGLETKDEGDKNE